MVKEKCSQRTAIRCSEQDPGEKLMNKKRDGLVCLGLILLKIENKIKKSVDEIFLYAKSSLI